MAVKGPGRSASEWTLRPAEMAAGRGRRVFRAAVIGDSRFRAAMVAGCEQLGTEVVAWRSAAGGRGGGCADAVMDTAARLGPRLDAVMAIVPSRGSPRLLAPGPVAAGVPIGLIPADSIQGLEAWLQAAASTRTAAAGEGVWAVLAEWDDRYLRRARAFARDARGKRKGAVRCWLANRLNGEALAARLNLGPRWVNYFGHGSEQGLAGYFGITAEDLLRLEGPPLGVFWCWACRTLGPSRGGASFGVRLVRGGRVAAFVGSVETVKTRANERLAALAAALAPESATVGALLRGLDAAVLREADAALARAWASYRLVGNPLEAL